MTEQQQRWGNEVLKILKNTINITAESIATRMTIEPTDFPKSEIHLLLQLLINTDFIGKQIISGNRQIYYLTQKGQHAVDIGIEKYFEKPSVKENKSSNTSLTGTIIKKLDNIGNLMDKIPDKTLDRLIDTSHPNLLTFKKMKTKNNAKYPKQKFGVFISHKYIDHPLVEIIKNKINKCDHLEAEVVMSRFSDTGKYLSEKVINSFKKSKIFLPLITENSIKEQWLHQEIGYAIAKEFRIFPLVESHLRGDLHAFINEHTSVCTYDNNNPKETFNKKLNKLVKEIDVEFNRMYLADLNFIDKAYLGEGELRPVKGVGGGYVVIHNPFNIFHPIHDGETFEALKKIVKKGKNEEFVPTKYYKLGVEIMLKKLKLK